MLHLYRSDTAEVTHNIIQRDGPVW